MKKLLLTILFLSFCNLANAELYYLFISKDDSDSLVAGQDKKGDVVAAILYNDRIEISPSELRGFQVIKVDLTVDEVSALVEANIQSQDFTDEITIPKEKEKEYEDYIAAKTGSKVDFKQSLQNIDPITSEVTSEFLMYRAKYKKEQLAEFRKKKVNYDAFSDKRQKALIERVEFFANVSDRVANIPVVDKRK